MKKTKLISRARRARKTRGIQRRLNAVRLQVFKSNNHIYAQIIMPGLCDTVAASASTLMPEIRKQLKHTGNVEAAKIVGSAIAEAAIKAGITKVAFDRSGFPYHGVIKALAEQARASGLLF